VIKLGLPRTDRGVCPVVAVILGRRGTGKTTLMQATAPIYAPRESLVIVSPLNTLPNRMPDVPWKKVSIFNKPEMEKVFREFNESGREIFILADEGDELTAGSAAGVAGGFQSPAVYDTLNYAREAGVGICISSRRPANIAKDMLGNANLVWVANTTDPGALDWYESFMQDPIHPDRDYRSICRVLPAVDTDGYSVFMVWSPGRKLLGYVTVDMAKMEIREWDPKELRERLKNAPAADATAPNTMTDTNGSAETSGTNGSDASGAGSLSETLRAAPIVRSISPK
jgi:hypothetical protein